MDMDYYVSPENRRLLDMATGGDVYLESRIVNDALLAYFAGLVKQATTEKDANICE